MEVNRPHPRSKGGKTDIAGGNPTFLDGWNVQAVIDSVMQSASEKRWIETGHA